MWPFGGKTSLHLTISTLYFLRVGSGIQTTWCSISWATLSHVVICALLLATHGIVAHPDTQSDWHRDWSLGVVDLAWNGWLCVVLDESAEPVPVITLGKLKILTIFEPSVSSLVWPEETFPISKYQDWRYIILHRYTIYTVSCMWMFVSGSPGVCGSGLCGWWICETQYRRKNLARNPQNHMGCEPLQTFWGKLSWSIVQRPGVKNKKYQASCGVLPQLPWPEVSRWAVGNPA